ncbi:MAG: Crp/Fnr family transcriptional regulator [Chromatiales bacterium]|nr:Crp/Fnr family transcriptional regulator [Chromatiales bacterium]
MGTLDNQLPCALLTRLQRYMDGHPADEAALSRLNGERRATPAGRRLIEQGARERSAILIHEGWAIQHRNLPDGRRQIIDFLLPGDFCDPGAFMLRQAGAAVSSITPVSYSLVGSQALLAAVTQSPRLGVCLWWIAAQEGALLRAHIVALGRMNARERIAYLVWELWHRLRLASGQPSIEFRMPASQEMIADAIGLSVVHVSRTLSGLEQDGIIRRRGHTWRIDDLESLCRIAQVTDRSWPEPMPRHPRHHPVA